MSSSTSIEQQHQEFKRQISTHDTHPCFLLDQTFQQRTSSPTANVMPSFLSAQAYSPLPKSPMPTPTASTSRLSVKQQNQYRLFQSSPSHSLNTNRINIRSTSQVADAPVEKMIVPLRTITDLFPSFSYSSMKTSNKQLSNDFMSIHQRRTSTAATGVSIFGFREEDIESIVEQFKEIGPIDKIERPLGHGNGNFLHITYTNHVSYQNALNRDGIVFNGYMIGVVPLMNK